MIRWLFVLVLGLAVPGFAANYYVSRNGSNGVGTSWATAWNECDQIKWTSVQAGDTVFLDGGADSMVYSTGITVGKAGTSVGRITIKRSAVAGHNGKVVMQSGVYTDYSYITIDGLDKYKFVFYVLGGGYIVRVTGTADFFEFKNTCLFTRFDTSNAWGTLFYANNAHLLIKDCWFHDTNSEDQIKYNGSGTIIIEDSYFSGLTEHGAIHEDVCQLDVDSVESVIVRRCMFANQGTDCFMMASTRINYAEYAYNVFISGGDAIKPLSCGNLVVYNCVFNNCRALIVYEATPTTVKNCIFNGTSSWGSSVYAGSGQYCIWNDNPSGYSAGTGNLKTDPLFVNKNSPLGTDGVPFTIDDGFMIASSSPARNAGSDVGLATDILGNPMVGNPDVGAYEYTTTGFRTVDCGSRIDPATQLLPPNPVRFAQLHQYLQEKKDVRVYDAAGKLMETNTFKSSALYFLKDGKNSIVYKVIVLD